MKSLNIKLLTLLVASTAVANALTITQSFSFSGTDGWLGGSSSDGTGTTLELKQFSHHSGTLTQVDFHMVATSKASVIDLNPFSFVVVHEATVTFFANAMLGNPLAFIPVMANEYTHSGTTVLAPWGTPGSSVAWSSELIVPLSISLMSQPHLDDFLGESNVLIIISSSHFDVLHPGRDPGRRVEKQIVGAPLTS